MAPPERAAPLGAGRARLLVATVLGLGRVPFAPGTAGSLAGLLLTWLCWWTAGSLGVLAGLVAVTALGLASAGAAAAHSGTHDPQEVVIDEVAGQMLSLLFLVPTPRSLAFGFVLFRLFDVLKPFPIGRLEALSGASGIMADDLLAGAYANGVQRLLHGALPDGWGGA